MRWGKEWEGGGGREKRRGSSVDRARDFSTGGYGLGPRSGS